MSWWFDKIAVEQTLKLRDKFQIKTYLETGTFRGLNIKFWSYYFDEVLGCEFNEEYYKISIDKVRDRKNIRLYNVSSEIFLNLFLKEYKEQSRKDMVLIYLDAHFYNPNLKKEKRFLVLDELSALRDFKNCIICIHDFACEGLSHISYDGQDLNFELIKNKLKEVNTFFYYTNTKHFSEVHSKDSILNVIGLDPDEDTLETLKYHNSDYLKYRGILYCVPSELNLQEFKLKKFTQNAQI